MIVIATGVGLLVVLSFGAAVLFGKFCALSSREPDPPSLWDREAADRAYQTETWTDWGMEPPERET